MCSTKLLDKIKIWVSEQFPSILTFFWSKKYVSFSAEKIVVHSSKIIDGAEGTSKSQDSSEVDGKFAASTLKPVSGGTFWLPKICVKDILAKNIHHIKLSLATVMKGKGGIFVHSKWKQHGNSFEFCYSHCISFIRERTSKFLATRRTDEC